MNSAKFIESIRNFDLEGVFLNLTASQDKHFGRLILSLFVLNIIAFFIFVAHHPLHGHGLRMPWIPPNDALTHGRWVNKFLLLKITNAADIPVLLPLMAIGLNVFAGIILLKVWRFKLSTSEKFIAIGIFSTFPVFLALYYYTWLTVLFTIGGFFAALSLFFCRRLHFIDIGIGALFVLLLMGSYQPSLSVLATIIACAAIADLNFRPENSISPTIKTLGARGIASAIGGILYYFSVKLTGATASHATKMLSADEFLPRIVQVIRKSFEHLTITQPDLLEPVKSILLLILILAVIASIYAARKSPLKIFLIILLWIGAIVGTKAMYLVSPDNNFFQYRYNTSLAFLHFFSVAIILHTVGNKLLRSIVMVLLAFTLLRLVQADLVRQEVLFRGQQHDIALANRILTRIETLPGLDFSKTYDLVRVGEYSNFRKNLLESKNHKSETFGDGHMDSGEISALWVDETIFIILGAKIKFKHTGFDGQFYTKQVDARKNLLEDRQPWPHKDSVFISDDKIILYMK